jgi:hypothetical protein
LALAPWNRKGQINAQCLAEILKDGNGVRRAFSDLAKAAVKLASVASSEESLEQRELASVIFTSARKLLRASVVKTECSLLISLGAEACPTAAPKTDRHGFRERL